MAFQWDDVQGRWLEQRVSGQSRRFESKVQVAGSSLEIDAVAEDLRGDAFFDFVRSTALFENKAPKVVFNQEHLLVTGARSLLYARRRRIGLGGLKELTQVVLCSRASRAVREEIGGRQLRSGVLRGVFADVATVLVEANRLDVEVRALPLLVLYATGERLREAIELVVDEELSQFYTVLWFYRAKEFKEILKMKGKKTNELTVSILEAIEDLGIRRVYEEVGIDRLVSEVGIERLVSEVGIERLVSEVGIERLVAEVGIERLVAEVGIERLVAEVGIERLVAEVGIERLVAEVGIERLVSEVGIERLVAEMGIEAIIEAIGLERLQETMDRLRKRRRGRRPRKDGGKSEPK